MLLLKIVNKCFLIIEHKSIGVDVIAANVTPPSQKLIKHVAHTRKNFVKLFSFFTTVAVAK
jgi:hypothetical protein